MATPATRASEPPSEAPGTQPGALPVPSGRPAGEGSTPTAMPAAGPATAAAPATPELSRVTTAGPPAGPGKPVPAAVPVVELQGLEVRFGKRAILKGLDAALSGRAIGLLGPNGAGKSTLLHTLLGFHPPSAGTARLFGRDVRSEAKAVRGSIGYMPENDSFVADMSGVRFVRLMAELSGLPPRQAMERAHEALFYVGLGEARYRPVGTYSLGMKQLAKLAQALVHGPRLLLLDEPTNGLDPPARERMLKLVGEIRDTGEVTVIISSHLLRDVEECCEEVLVLKDGRIAAHCNLEAERRANRKFLEIEVRDGAGAPGAPGAGEGAVEADFAAAVQGLGCEIAWAGRQRIKLVLPEGVEIRDLYRLAGERGVQIRRLDYKRDSLEDIFLKAMESTPERGGEVRDGGL